MSYFIDTAATTVSNKGFWQRVDDLLMVNDSHALLIDSFDSHELAIGQIDGQLKLMLFSYAERPIKTQYSPACI